ncbi:MAG: YfhO family protein, partial [Chloroflexi bacterium]|nr:YfhO family protein [Chloroflexota bacterium]
MAVLLVGPALFGDQALLPGAELLAMAPWAAPGVDPARLPWNPLLWDAAAQFYPWRLFAARWIERGVLPLWNPHQFCGTPFLANSQSALLYPLNWLIYLPLGLSVTRAMALVAWLHLTLAGGLMFLWLRGLGVARPAAFTAGVAYTLSGFIITWLELPTFLSVACWLSLLFWSIHRLVHGPTVPSALGAGVVVGLTLLGGHLQIAFYCLLGAGLYGIVELARVAWSKRASGDPRRLRVGEGTGEGSVASGGERRCG